MTASSITREEMRGPLCSLARSALPVVEGAAWGVPVWKSPKGSPKEPEKDGVQGTGRLSSCGGGGDWQRLEEKGKGKRKEKGKDVKVFMTAFLARSTQSLNSTRGVQFLGILCDLCPRALCLSNTFCLFLCFPHHVCTACYVGLPNYPRGTLIH